MPLGSRSLTRPGAATRPDPPATSTTHRRVRRLVLAVVAATAGTRLLTILAPSLLPWTLPALTLRSVSVGVVALSVAALGCRAVAAALHGSTYTDITQDRLRGDTPAIRWTQAGLAVTTSGTLLALLIPSTWTVHAGLAGIAVTSITTMLVLGGRVGYDSQARARCVGTDRPAHFIARGLHPSTNPDGTVVCYPCAAALARRTDPC